MTDIQIYNAKFYGRLMGKDMAHRQVTRDILITSGFFDAGELERNAKISARNQAIEQRVGTAIHEEWEGLFIEAYKEAYAAKWQASRQ